MKKINTDIAIIIFAITMILIGIGLPVFLNFLYNNIIDFSIISVAVTTATALFVLYITISDSNNTKKLSYMPSIIIEYGKIDYDNQRITGTDFTIFGKLVPAKKVLWQGQNKITSISVIENGWVWQISLKNVGNGVAQALSISIKSDEYNENIEDLIIEKEKSLSISICLPMDIKCQNVEFLLRYTDLVGNRYEQRHIFKLDDNNNYGSPMLIPQK